jgi:hypothetical protein
MKKGDAVYIKGTVTHAPQGDRTLYRVVTESEGSIVWCTPDEVVPREGED